MLSGLSTERPSSVQASWMKTSAISIQAIGSKRWAYGEFSIPCLRYNKEPIRTWISTTTTTNKTHQKLTEEAKLCMLIRRVYTASLHLKTEKRWMNKIMQSRMAISCTCTYCKNPCLEMYSNDQWSHMTPNSHHSVLKGSPYRQHDNANAGLHNSKLSSNRRTTDVTFHRSDEWLNELNLSSTKKQGW